MHRLLLLALAALIAAGGPARAQTTYGLPEVGVGTSGTSRPLAVRNRATGTMQPLGALEAGGFRSTPNALTLPDNDNGSTGNVSGMSVTPNGSAAANTLARLIFDRVYRVTNLAGLQAAPILFGRVLREGYATAGDGGAAAYTYSAGACAISGGDGGSQVPAAPSGCWLLDPATPRFAPQIWGAKGDSNGTAGNGTADDAAFARWLDYGKLLGRTLHVPALPIGRMYRLTQPLLIDNKSAIIDGDYFDNAYKAGSILFFDHAGRGLDFRVGSNRVSNIATWRAQPAAATITSAGTLTNGQTQIGVGSTSGMNLYDPVSANTGVPAGSFITAIPNGTTILINNAATASGSVTLTVKDFTPGSFDYDIYTETDIDLRSVVLLNPTKGAFAKYGRFWIDNLKGQPLTVGIGTYALLDTAKIDNVHFWPYWSNAQEVYAWKLRNLTAFDLRRMDNAQMTNISSIIQKNGVKLSANPASEAPYQGAVNKLRMTNADFDVLAGSGILIDSSVGYTNGVATADFTNFTTQSFNGPGAAYYPSNSLRVAGSGNTLGFNGYTGTFSAGNDISISGVGNKIIFSGRSTIQSWGMQATSFPAVAVDANNLVRGLQSFIFDNVNNPSATTYFGGGYFTDQWAQDGLWRTRAVTPGSTVGTLTSATGSMSAAVNGQTVTFSGTASVTTNGSADGSLTLPLPYTPTVNTIVSARNQSTGSPPLVGIINAGDSRVFIQKATDATYPAAAGGTFAVSGSYPIAP